jgi:hypothetical protein
VRTGRTAAWLLCALAIGVAEIAGARLIAQRATAPAMEPWTGADADAIVWSATRRLEWEDFKAPAPTGGVEGAHTVYQLTYETRCRGNAFQYMVAAVFLPHQSWVKATVRRDEKESARVLQHERTHFDISEAYARRIRKYFTELYNPCRQPDEQVQEFVDRYVTEESEAQKRYDDETRFGLAPDHQRLWDHDIAATLKSLAAFTAK